MAGKQGPPDDYREVPERIAEWYARHPDARIIPEVIENTDARVVVKASVFKTQDPAEVPTGVGHSYLAYPGKTPFTRDSELENAETSAVGRALVMAGIPAKTISSAHEVSMKQGPSTEPAEGSSPAPTTPASSGGGPDSLIDDAQARSLRALFPSPAAATKTAREVFGDPNITSLKQLTVAQANVLVAFVEESDGSAEDGAYGGYGS
jgi:hypothetical protein